MVRSDASMIVERLLSKASRPRPMVTPSLLQQHHRQHLRAGLQPAPDGGAIPPLPARGRLGVRSRADAGSPGRRCPRVARRDVREGAGADGRR